MSLFSTEEKLTPAQWKERLAQENTAITLDEYVAGAIIRMAGSVQESALATRHIEGMLGAIDESFSRHDEQYAGSATVREALDTRRRALSGGPNAIPDIVAALQAVAALGPPPRR